jgi:UDP-glucose 4-epimerase
MLLAARVSAGGRYRGCSRTCESVHIEKIVTPTIRAARVLVWGARGFIGRHLVSELLARGRVVAVLTRGGAGVEPSWRDRVTWHDLGCGSRRAIFAAALADADVVYNLAGSSGAVASNRAPRTSLEATCAVQLEFLEACAAAGRIPHVVFASSRLVYAPRGLAPVGETDAIGPRSMYAAHKLCVEHYHAIYARAQRITYTVARISNPFGADHEAGVKTYGVINTMIDRAQRGLPLVLFGRGRQRRDYLYIGDLTDALVRCGDMPAARNQIFNIGQGHSMSMYEAALTIADRTGRPPIEFAPWPDEYEAVESGDYVADVSKAAALLGFVPRFTFASGLDEMLGVAGPAIDAGDFAAVRQSV